MDSAIYLMDLMNDWVLRNSKVKFNIDLLNSLGIFVRLSDRWNVAKMKTSQVRIRRKESGKGEVAGQNRSETAISLPQPSCVFASFLPRDCSTILEPGTGY